MSETPEQPTPTPEERVAQLEADLALAQLDLDGVKTANAVLQERYGSLADQCAALGARIDALEA